MRSGPGHQQRGVFCTGGFFTKYTVLFVPEFCFGFIMISKWTGLRWLRGRLLNYCLIFLLPQIFCWSLRAKFREADLTDVLIKLNAYLSCLSKSPQKFPLPQCSDFLVLPIKVPAGKVSAPSSEQAGSSSFETLRNEVFANQPKLHHDNFKWNHNTKTKRS